MSSLSVVASSNFGGDQVIALALLLVVTFVASGIAGVLIDREAKKVTSRQH